MAALREKAALTAALAPERVRAELEQMKDITLLGDALPLKSALQPQQEAALATLADQIAASL